MMEQQFKEICEREGVTPSIKQRGHKKYLYVSRWVPGPNKKGKIPANGGITVEQYVCPASLVEELDETTLMDKINRLPINPNRAKPARELKALNYLFGASDSRKEGK